MTLGRIIVDLLARTGSFDTDLNRSAKLADKRAREIDAAFRRAGKAIGVALAAGATAAAVALKSTIDRMDDMSKAAQKVGLPTEEFSKLTHAADLADVSMDTLTTALGRLTKAQAASEKAGSTQARVFDALGISVKDANGNLRNSSDVLIDFADKFQQLQGKPEAMAAGFALFGRSFQELVPLLKDGGDGIRAAGDELESLGGVLSTEAGRAAEEFNDNLDRLKTAALGLAMNVARDLLPELVSLTNNLVQLTKEGNAAADIGSTIANGFKIAAGAFITLDATVRGVTSDLIAFVNVMKAVGQVRGFDFAGAAESMKQANIAREQAAEQSTRIGAVFDGSAFKPKGPDFSGVRGTVREQQSPVDLGRLRGAFGDAPKAGGKKNSGGKSDAEREAERLASSYDRMVESLKEQLALHGETSEVARVRYETENGELAKLTQAQKDNLLGLAAQRDAQIEHDKLVEQGKQLTESLITPTEELNQKRKEAADLLKAGVISQEAYNKAIAAYRDPGQQMLDDLQFELELLRMTNAERATAIQLRGMDADQIQRYGAEIAETNKKIEESLRQTEFMDEFRANVVDMFTDVATGSKSAKDAVLDFFDSFIEMVIRATAERWVEKFFGAFGTTGQGSTGGDWMQVFAGLFSGARANGGPVMGGGSYLVGERGPELFVPRTAGTIVPAGQTASMTGGTTLAPTYIFNVPANRLPLAELRSKDTRLKREASRRNG